MHIDFESRIFKFEKIFAIYSQIWNCVPNRNTHLASLILKPNLMKKIERNRLYMIQAVNKVGIEYAEAYQNYEEFKELFGIVKNYEERLRSLSRQKELLAKPFGKVKEELKEDFTHNCTTLAAYMRRIGRQNKDRALILAVSISPSQFRAFSLQKIRLTAENILSFTEQYQSVLEEIPKAQELIEKVESQLASFVEKGLVPAERRRKLGETTEMIKRTASEMLDFLRNELDPMMLVFKVEAPAFYLSYRNARVTPKLSGAQGPDRPKDDVLKEKNDEGSEESPFDIAS